jgi:perosamine synthetase
MPVHLYGATCDMTEIMKIAKEYNLAVIEDCAQNYLGQHKGKYAGTFGDVASWSFENSKHLTTGDGGIIACDSEELGDKIRKLNCQGYKNATAVSGKIRIGKDIFQDPSYKRHSVLGYMYRLPEVCAAMGLAQLEKIEWFVGLRQTAAHYYLSAIMDSGENWLVPQHISRLDTSSYYTYACKLRRNDINWQDFRMKYKELSGDGIYAAWTLLMHEGSVDNIKQYMESLKLSVETFNTVCPNAEIIQPQLMQFPTNMKDTEEMKKCAEALYKTIMYFK